MTVTVTTLREKRAAFLGLPAPEVPMTPYAYAFGGFQFGHGTRYIVESFKGIIGNAASSNGLRNEGTHGSIPALQTLDPKTMTLRIRVDAAYGEDGQAVIDTLNRAFRQPLRQLNTYAGDFDSRGYFTDSDAGELRIMRPGWTEPRIIFCRVISTNVESNYDTAMGDITFDVLLRADDPLHYGYDVKIITIPRGESIDWEQDGDIFDGYPPYIILSGPLKNPKVTCNYTNFFAGEPGRDLALSFKVAGITDMRIDMRNRLVDPMGAALQMVDQKFWYVAPTPTVARTRQRLSFDNDLAGAVADIYVREVWGA